MTVPTREANGASIPILGLGTYGLKGDEARAMAAKAIEIGYRHIDTAAAYGNEADVGAGIADSGLARGDLFVTTKVWPDHFEPSAMRRSAAESLERLGLDHVDLLLLHWPNPDVPLSTSVPALCGLQKAGLARHVGISNFNVKLIEEAVRIADVPLAVNQVEYHPFLTQRDVLAALGKAGMALTAYSPIARGKVVGNEVLERIAARHGKSAVQVTLRWLVQQDVIAIPKTSSEENARANMAIFDFTLTDEEMREIHALGSPAGRMIEMDAYAPEWDAA